MRICGTVLSSLRFSSVAISSRNTRTIQSLQRSWFVPMALPLATPGLLTRKMNTHHTLASPSKLPPGRWDALHHCHSPPHLHVPSSDTSRQGMSPKAMVSGMVGTRSRAGTAPRCHHGCSHLLSCPGACGGLQSRQALLGALGRHRDVGGEDSQMVWELLPSPW